MKSAERLGLIRRSCVSGGFKGRGRYPNRRFGAGRRRTRSQALMADSESPLMGKKRGDARRRALGHCVEARPLRVMVCVCPYACLSEAGFRWLWPGALECTTTKVCMELAGKRNGKERKVKRSNRFQPEPYHKHDLWKLGIHLTTYSVHVGNACRPYLQAWLER